MYVYPYALNHNENMQNHHEYMHINLKFNSNPLVKCCAQENTYFLKAKHFPKTLFEKMPLDLNKENKQIN